MKLAKLLPLHDFYRSQYLAKLNNGISVINNANIVILCLVRNLENKLQNNIDILFNFFSKHNSNIQFVFYENDSLDKTTDILKQYKNEYPKNFHIISEKLNREQFGPVKSFDRVKALAEYRNKLKEYAKNLVSDFIIVLDMDFDDISLDGILNSFGWLAYQPEISAIAGNSFEYKKGLVRSDPEKYNLWNYDSWAFRQNWWIDFHHAPPYSGNNIDPMLWFGLYFPPTGSSLVTVNSAFGGCCIYRSDIYFKGEYGDTDCEHVCFHYSLYSDPNNKFILTLNPSQQMMFIV